MDSPADVAAMRESLQRIAGSIPAWQGAECYQASAMLERLVERVKVAEGDAAALRKFVDSNMTFMDVDADWPVEGPNIPALAQVSNRIWYHATDDVTSYPFSAAIDAAITAEGAG